MPTNSLNVDPVAREPQVVAFLDELPLHLGPILIGGYATAAYGPPRFSVDVDLVFPSSSLAGATTWFDSNGIHYKRTLEFEGVAGTMSKLLISRGLVSGDIYLGALRARETGTQVDYDWIAGSPQHQRLNLTTGSTKNPIPIARAEVPWVLKLLAGRAQDLTDLFVISGWEFDRRAVRGKLEELTNDETRTHFRKVRARLENEREYKDALSRRGLGSPSAPQNKRLW